MAGDGPNDASVAVPARSWPPPARPAGQAVAAAPCRTGQMVDAWHSALVRRRRRYRLPAPDAVVGSVVHAHSLADRDPARTECPRGCGARLVGGGGISGRGPLLAAPEHHGF